MCPIGDLVDDFLKALNRSRKEIGQAYADQSRKDNTTLITMFGSAALATIEYDDDVITIQWEDAMRKVLGITKLSKSNKKMWIEEFRRLKETINVR